jgi:hypothetical protein
MIRVTIGPVIYYASYSLMRYDYAHMNDNIERRNKNSKNPSQRGDNNKNKRTIASSDIKKPHGAGYYRTQYRWREPTRSDE